jgi:type IV secretion system protein VirB6
MCLIFDQTKDLFKRWVMYGIGTLFSFAVLNFVVSIALKLCIALAAATWLSTLTNTILQIQTEGDLTGQALPSRRFG